MQFSKTGLRLYFPKDLQKIRSYLILAEHKETGKIFGYCEESFSMGYYPNNARRYIPYFGSEFLHGFTLKNLKSLYAKHIDDLKKEVIKLNQRRPEYRHFVVRANSKNCPVRINWTKWYAERKQSKFIYRNLPFELK